MDVGRIFNNVLLQQTQATDCHGEDSMTTLYTRWFLDVLLRRVSASAILFTPHLAAFVNSPNTDAPAPFNAQEYTDFNGSPPLLLPPRFPHQRVSGWRAEVSSGALGRLRDQVPLRPTHLARCLPNQRDEGSFELATTEFIGALWRPW